MASCDCSTRWSGADAALSPARSRHWWRSPSCWARSGGGGASSPTPSTSSSTRRSVAEANGQDRVVGYTTTVTLMRAAETLLDKPGGYLYNDVTPPSVFLDNMPSWEYGALVQIRDLARTMRNEISRSQSQSRENEDLSQAEPRLNFDANSWLFPSTEGEYRAALEYLTSYRDQLADRDASGAQFYARADNLREWLSIVEKRLGGIAQRLGASVGELRANVDLAGEPAARQSTPTGADTAEQTPGWRSTTSSTTPAAPPGRCCTSCARVQIDFADVLADKNAERSVEQVIRSLEATQRVMGSPVVLNGDGFGMLANHSLVMASYVSRANAGIIDLRRLLEQG
ncbi:MAG: DUF2333 family protein [Halofilum sp. (in: g-proteobacteria)]|nr:DUF2333 family protein [Halofilum sp. (in: g-proteobacteria)]